MPKLVDTLTDLVNQGASDEELRTAAAFHHTQSWGRRADNTVKKREEELLSDDASVGTVYSNPQLPSGRIENLFKWVKTKANIAAKKTAGLPVTPEDIE